MKNFEKHIGCILEKSACCTYKYINKNNLICDRTCTTCKEKEKVINWLLEEYKEPIKLTKFEYDLLGVYSVDTAFCGFEALIKMKQKGYFENVVANMKIADILENCEVM